MNRSLVIVLASSLMLQVNATPCTLVSGDCPQRARPSAQAQTHQQQAFINTMRREVREGTGLDPNADLQGQLLSRLLQHSPADAIAQVGLASAAAAHFCFWAGSHAHAVTDYDFNPNAPLLMARDEAVFHHGNGICDCYQLTPAVVKASHHYATVLMQTLLSLTQHHALSSPPALTAIPEKVDGEVQKSITQDKHTIAAFAALKQEQPGVKCEALLQTYLATLAQCPKPMTRDGTFTPCPTYQEDYGS